MRTARTHTEFFPLVWLDFDDEFTNEDFLVLLNDNEALFAKRQPFCTIRDGRRVKTMPNAVQRKIAAMWQEEFKVPIHEYCLGVVTVMPSAIARNLLTAVHWASKPATTEQIEERM